MTTIAFVNQRAGTGKTFLTYHLAWMYADLGLRVLACDLDPQAELSIRTLPDERLTALWQPQAQAATVLAALRPLLEGRGELGPLHIEPVAGVSGFGLVAGDLGLARYEGELSAAWVACTEGQVAACQISAALQQLVQAASRQYQADVVLLDVGSNLDALTRAALLAADYVVVPLAPDVYALQGLADLGMILRQWREQRQRQRDGKQSLVSRMEAAGYVVLQPTMRLDRPDYSFDYWQSYLPELYHRHILGHDEPPAFSTEPDPEQLAQLRHYTTLLDLSQEAKRPIFRLRLADGAGGYSQRAVAESYWAFRKLAMRLAERCGVQLPADMPQTPQPEPVAA